MTTKQCRHHEGAATALFAFLGFCYSIPVPSQHSETATSSVEWSHVLWLTEQNHTRTTSALQIVCLKPSFNIQRYINRPSPASAPARHGPLTGRFSAGDTFYIKSFHRTIKFHTSQTMSLSSVQKRVLLFFSTVQTSMFCFEIIQMRRQGTCRCLLCRWSSCTCLALSTIAHSRIPVLRQLSHQFVPRIVEALIECIARFLLVIIHTFVRMIFAQQLFPPDLQDLKLFKSHSIPTGRLQLQHFK